MPLFNEVSMPDLNRPGMSTDEKIQALANMCYELNTRFGQTVNNLDGDNFSNAYADETGSIASLTQKVAALEQSMNALQNYPVSEKYESVHNAASGADDTWYVRRWKSGFLEAITRIQATNAAPITYAASNGVYRSDPALLLYGVKFPSPMTTSVRVFVTVRGLRTGFNLQNMAYDANGITSVRLWAPTVDPFNVTGSLYLDLSVRIEGIPI